MQLDLAGTDREPQHTADLWMLVSYSPQTPFLAADFVLAPYKHLGHRPSALAQRSSEPGLSTKASSVSEAQAKQEHTQQPDRFSAKCNTAGSPAASGHADDHRRSDESWPEVPALPPTWSKECIGGAA